MPGRDGTGPLGVGPMTGRAMGNCAGAAGLGYANPVPGRSFSGRGFGRGGGGRGCRYGYRATGLPGWMRFGWGVQAASAASPSDAECSSMLQGQAEMLQKQLDTIRMRLDALAANADAVKP